MVSSHVLHFLGKILERAGFTQLHRHMSIHELHKPLQSGFTIHHSTETTLIRITNNLLIVCDSGYIGILILPNFSAAFDTVSHTVLLTCLSDYLGLTYTTLSWFKSNLSHWEQFETHGDCCSPSDTLNQGVPQGSVLGPLSLSVTRSYLVKLSAATVLAFTPKPNST